MFTVSSFPFTNVRPLHVGSPLFPGIPFELNTFEMEQEVALGNLLALLASVCCMNKSGSEFALSDQHRTLL